jgi:hypothetical protein
VAPCYGLNELAVGIGVVFAVPVLRLAEEALAVASASKPEYAGHADLPAPHAAIDAGTWPLFGPETFP